MVNPCQMFFFKLWPCPKDTIENERRSLQREGMSTSRLLSPQQVCPLDDFLSCPVPVTIQNVGFPISFCTGNSGHKNQH